MKKALIIGGGIAGCASAHLLELKGNWEVDLVERSSHLGAGVKTQWYGGHPYTFGPRHFLTTNRKVFDYLNKYCPLRLCSDHIFLSYVQSDQNFYNYPIHVDDIPRMPEANEILGELKEKGSKNNTTFQPQNLEEYWKSSVGDILYLKFIEQYSKKMWQISDNRLIDDFSWSPKGVALKDGPREAWTEAISAYPIASDGYDAYFEIATKSATVYLNTTIESFNIPRKEVVFDGHLKRYDIVINTIAPDLIFDECFGPLPFVGRQFYKFILPVQFAFPENVYFLYYTGNEPFTRLVEYKKFTRQRYDENQTIIGMEIPVIDGGRHYPMPFKKEIALAHKYFSLMPSGVFSIGRAGSYMYKVDIDDCIEQAMNVVESI